MYHSLTWKSNLNYSALPVEKLKKFKPEQHTKLKAQVGDKRFNGVLARFCLAKLLEIFKLVIFRAPPVDALASPINLLDTFIKNLIVVSPPRADRV